MRRAQRLALAKRLPSAPLYVDQLQGKAPRKRAGPGGAQDSGQSAHWMTVAGLVRDWPLPKASWHCSWGGDWVACRACAWPRVRAARNAICGAVPACASQQAVQMDRHLPAHAQPQCAHVPHSIVFSAFALPQGLGITG